MERSTLSWGRFEWRAGVDTYSFEIDRGGLFATLRPPNAPALQLPLVAWEGLIEAIKMNHKTRVKSQTDLPPRAGARWSDAETMELERGFRSGSTVAALARQHSRTTWAIESQLVRIGLMERRDQGHAIPVAGSSPARGAGGPP